MIMIPRNPALIFPFMTKLDLPPSFIFAFFGYSKPFLLPSANRHANAKLGEKKRRREVNFSLKGKKEMQIKFPAIPGS